MTWWSRVRAVPAVVAVTAGTLLLASVSTGLIIPFPALFGGVPPTVPLALVLPLAIAVVVAFALDRADPAVEVTASRPVARYDGALVAVVAGTCLAVALLPDWAARSAVMQAVGRNSLGYVSLTLLAGRFLPSAAALPAAFWAVAASVLGRQTGGHIADWAWPVAPGDQRSSWVICCALAVAAAATVLARRAPVLAPRGGQV